MSLIPTEMTPLMQGSSEMTDDVVKPPSLFKRKLLYVCILAETISYSTVVYTIYKVCGFLPENST